MNRMFRTALAIGIGAAAFAVMAPASADVPRFQTAAVGLHTNVVGHDQHNYTLVFNPCDGSIQGTGLEVAFGYDENLTCTLAGDILSCHGVYLPMTPPGPFDNYAFTYTWDVNGPEGIASAGGIDYQTEFAMTAVESIWRNHGAFVAANPDKNDAAHSCIGMPINSNK